MNILAIETCSQVGSLSVRSGESERHWIGNQQVSRSEDLLPSIEKVLRESRIDLKGLEAIVVAVGPGSFTGLRIGISAAQGLAFALGIRCVGVSILESLAAAVFNGKESYRQVTSLAALARNFWVQQTFLLVNGLVEAVAAEKFLNGNDEVFGEIRADQTRIFAIDRETFHSKLLPNLDGALENLIRVEQNLATWVGLVGKRKIERGIDSESVVPQYLLS
jgi:tRNA threonylcarbamoyl adenosine modification protein YeaZ